MKKIILLVSILVSTLAFGQEEVPFKVLGIWSNTEGETLVIQRAEDLIIFTRKDRYKILAQGQITMVNGDMHINRYDTEEEYRLGLFIGNETMVINKPNSISAWLWTKIQ
jgi:hypothetical protein